MNVLEIIQLVHEQCDTVMKLWEVLPFKEERRVPLGGGIIYQNPSKPRFSVQVFGEISVLDGSSSFTIHILDNQKTSETPLNVIAEDVFHDSSFDREHNLNTLKSVYEKYGKNFFSESVLTDSRIQWF